MKTNLNLYPLRVYHASAKLLITISFFSFFFVDISTVACAQLKTITGIVKDDENHALPAASVSVKGTTDGVLTNENGQFTIRLDASRHDILVFSFMGMKTSEVSIAEKTELSVTLYADPTFFTELVVTGAGASGQLYTEKKSGRKGLFKKRKALF